MPIKVVCQCGQRFSANDKMAGRRVKCPKCNQPLTIPGQKEPEELRLAPPAEPAPRTSPLMDLLDEAGVKHAAKGPVCPECAAEIQPDAVVCIECGFDLVQGRKIKQYEEFDDDAEMAGMSETDKMLAKAERELEDTPVIIDEEDFGDGPESMLIALGAILGAAALVGAAIGSIFLFDRLDEDVVSSATVTLIVGILMYLVGKIWILIVAFNEHVGQGLACLFLDIYVPIFGFRRLKGLWGPMVSHFTGLMAVLAWWISTS